MYKMRALVTILTRQMIDGILYIGIDKRECEIFLCICFIMFSYFTVSTYEFSRYCSKMGAVAYIHDEKL